MNYTLIAISQMPVQIRVSTQPYTEKNKALYTRRHARAGAHEVQEEQPAGPPEGDSEGDRRQKRRLGVRAGAAAAASSDAGAGLRPRHVHEAVALLRAVRDLAGDGAHADFRRRRRGPQAAETLKRHKQHKQREEAHVVVPHDLRGVQHVHGQAERRVQYDAHAQDLPPDHDRVREAHR